MRCKKGEIWNIETTNGASPAVVVQAFDRYAVILKLLEEERPSECPLTIRAGQMMYGDAGRLQHAYDAVFVDYIRRLTEEEFQSVKDAVAEALELGENCSDDRMPAGFSETKKEPLQAEPDREEEIYEIRRECIVLQSEVDTYKKLYEGLLDRILRKGA